MFQIDGNWHVPRTRPQRAQVQPGFLHAWRIHVCVRVFAAQVQPGFLHAWRIHVRVRVFATPTTARTGPTHIWQVEECISAFKLELPEPLMAAVDELHEQFREPTMFYHSKQVCMDAKWVGASARHASEPRSWVKALAFSPAVRIAAAAVGGAMLATLAARRK